MANTQTGATLVLGASGDIGRALIKTLCGDVVAHYNSRPQALEKLSAPGLVLHAVGGDLSSEAGILAFLADVDALGLSVQKIVHLPAAAPTPTRFHKLTADDFGRQYNLSVLSAALVCRHFLPAMAKEKFGRIVFMLTSYVLGAPPKYLADYVSAKYALLGLMRALAAEYGPKGITVNGVAPSMVETQFLQSLPDFEVESAAKQSPLGRNAAPADIVPALELLLADESGYINGAVIPVTAGSVM